MCYSQVKLGMKLMLCFVCEDAQIYIYSATTIRYFVCKGLFDKMLVHTYGQEAYPTSLRMVKHLFYWQ